MTAVAATRSLESVLPIDQAAKLQDLANGAADSTDMFVSAAQGDEDEDQNGDESRFDYLFEEAEDEDHTYPVLGLDTVQEDPALILQDSAALLECLANYEPTPLENESRAPPLLNDHDHFESLLQAAATAEIEAAEGDRSQVCDNFALYDEFDAYEYLKRSFDPLPIETGINNKANHKRKPDEEYEPEDDSGTNPRTPKRQKTTSISDEDADAEQLALERELWGPSPEARENEDSISPPEQQDSPVPDIDARSYGLHSATALFRRPSSASKKYTRAPMSKLFTSLELTAEQFLQMQSAAKAYMLDPNHPERSDCVGKREKGDTDMVKLKLFACVESFLEDEGWGPRYFSDTAERSQSRKLRWPQMKNKIIQLVTPLMRRMVTNERQRLYALEARQKERTKIPGSNQARMFQIPAAEEPRRSEIQLTKNLTPTRRPVVNPKLDAYHYSPNLSSHLNGKDQGEEYLDPEEPAPSIPREVGENSPNGMSISCLVNVVYAGRRIHPQVTLKPDTCPGYPSLVQHIHKIIDSTGQAYQVDCIAVLGATGLVSVRDEDSWKAAVNLVQQYEWLDGEIKCVVQVVDKVVERSIEDRIIVDLVGQI